VSQVAGAIGRSLILVLLVSTSVGATAALTTATGTVLASDLDPPPDEECTLDNKGEKRPHPVPGVVWRCLCPAGATSDDQCHWMYTLDFDNEGVQSRGYALSSSTYGCLYTSNVLVSQYVGGPTNAGAASGIGEYYPCDHDNPKPQPAGEYRMQAVLERWNGSSWVAVTPLGYHYNASTSIGTGDYYNMGGAPDGGNGTYRMSATMGIYEGGAWRGGTRWAPQIFMN
jgi:hypothetical protein